ncbi:hypothetical protein BP5796_11163 [Coleophoma crateriformis]|uniref:Flo11 n=1 Tax=Coleophoma crateriformis TaxID=565419 RepID=A0A3D8QMD7_9HELO|nr:hypothetical protein BP5796_11163 [Coleophoma crateriformis]
MAPSLAEITSNGRAMEGHTSPRLGRSQSISSDRPSMNGYGSMVSPPTISPEPAFIAASAASQIVTNDHDSRTESWFDQHGIEPSGETALVAPAALKLVNKFLDQLLFNFLLVSRSTSLASLRPAVSEILKPRLAKDAISGADQELHEYLGGGEDEELLAFHNGTEPSGDWDLELVWKRTRLRCMVYSSLGDMEEEDEDYYTEQYQLDTHLGSNDRFSNNPGVVSPAVAIFLTSILEFMGEQALVIAGQAAYHRLRSKAEKEDRDGLSTPAEIAERVVVDESDMERVALDRTLGRLWRGWKKRLRSPTASFSMSRSFSRESLNSIVNASRSASIVPNEHDIEEVEPTVVVSEQEQASMVPLPMTEDDVREIEIPGLAAQSDDEGEDLEEDHTTQPSRRPKSMMVFPSAAPQPPTPSSSQPQTPQSPAFLKSSTRKRSNSLPSPAATPYSSPVKHSKAAVNSVENQSPVFSAGDVSKDGVNGVIASATVVGAGAVAVVKAAANSKATPATSTEKDESDEVELNEVPQIMTSSRISIGGRISPDDIKDASRRSSLRSASLHSLRVIDVSSPRSPIARQNSGEGMDYVASGRAVSLSRPASLHSPIIVEASSPRNVSPLRTQSSSPIIRQGSSFSSRQGTLSEDAISEADEHDEQASNAGATRTDRAPAVLGLDQHPVSSQGHGPEITSRGSTPKPTSFVLGSAPPPRSAARELAKAAINKATQPGTIPESISRNLATHSGVPSQTSLHETMKNAPDTSDEASSIAPSYDTHSTSDRSVKNQSSRSTEQDSARGTNRSSPSRNAKVPPEPRSRHRPAHNSGSSSSSISHKLKPVRTSEDGARGEAKGGQSFDELIRSDQTIQYTLTPQSMRNIESADSLNTTATRPSGSDPRPGTGRTHSGSITKLTGLHSNPPDDSVRPGQGVKNAGPSKLRPNTPRDARVDRDSIGDFAEFIRSTGPPEAYNVKPPRTAPATNGHRGRQASSSAPRVTPPAALPRRAESSAGRSRLQAREAVVPHGDTSSELIDFIRQGPPSTGGGDHRIPRTVAPFRNTMDSDQMSGAVGGKAIDAALPGPRHSQVSTNLSNDPSMQSNTSSVSSQSPLVSANKAASSPANKRNEFDAEDMMPKRKTRRVKDPYAIDFSDEEDELQVAVSRKPKPIKEESLADFLRNVPPPPENDPPALAPLTRKELKKKASAPSLMSRFGRGPTPALPPKPQSSKGYESRSTSRGSNATQKAPGATPATKTSNNSSPTYSSTRGNDNYVSKVDSVRNPSGGSGKVLQKTYTAREAATYTGTRTNDLAEFLRSDPPPGMAGPTALQISQASHHKEESSGFSRMFGRRRKVAT